MQRIIQRAKRAQRVAERRQEKYQDHIRKGESWDRNETRKRLQRSAAQLVKESRVNRRVDWEAGLLAPRRDVGDSAKTYGAVSIYNFMMPEKDPQNRPKWTHIAEGDRVVIMKGIDRGKIGTVDDVNLDSASLKVKGMNMKDVYLPEWMKQQEADTREIQSIPQSLLLEDVKLVYPLPDPETGIPRDVIIDRMRCINRKYDKNKLKWEDGDRVIAGTNTIIPWPETLDPTYEDNESDTLRISVEEQTVQPFLIRPPMPLSVIDELRNKYSRFRTRHDYEYMARKELEDAKAEGRKDLITTMRTPLQELAELRASTKKEQEKELTDEQLAKIGEVIAQQREKVTGAVRALGR